MVVITEEFVYLRVEEISCTFRDIIGKSTILLTTKYWLGFQSMNSILPDSDPLCITKPEMISKCQSQALCLRQGRDVGACGFLRR